uniref:RING-type E3 ubiquitin transferase n=1 Tax=Graphocephala atropunctata TaxID=36148 RepID=A0A1B6M7B1_9HEMI
MERPERPSRHKSNPVKFRPNFSSDSDSELNENDAPMQITFYDHHPPESANVSGGPSTSATTQPTSQSSTETPNNLMRVTPPLPTASQQEEPPPEPAPPEIRRKRCGATLAATSAAASVIFDSVDNLIDATSNSNRSDSPERPLERFQHSDYVIRPRSFCNLECSNAIIRPPVFKLKRPNGPIDLTPNPTNRDPACPVVTSSFSLCDNPALPSGAETSSGYLNRLSFSGGAYKVQRSPQGNQPSTSSSILRHFDEMCNSNPVYRRRNKGTSLNVRFLETRRGYDGSNSENSLSTNRESSRNRINNSLDDYCDLVGNFLFRYPSPPASTDNQRSTPLTERVSDDFTSAGPSLSGPSLSAPGPSLSAPSPTLPDLIRERNATLNDFTFITSYNPLPITVSEPIPIRQVAEIGEPMEQSNDDVIVVETPERPTLSSSPDSYMVPSSRTPTPQLQQPPASQPARDKAQSNNVPMTLQELNQTLVSLLECPVCLDHATPPIYQCCKGHILCQNCHPRLTTCPICRSHLPGDRNSAMEKVAEKLMYPCKNTVTGCSMMLKLDDKQEHEEGCGFRHYACIVSTCHWKGYKPELVVHLQSNHSDRLISGSSKEVQVPLTVQVGGAMFISHHWIQSAHNEVFNVIFHVDLYKKIMKGCVIYIGSPDKAEKFRYQFELKQRFPPYRSQVFSRRTHADTVKPGQTMCVNSDFSFNIDLASIYRSEISKALNTIPIFITILQEE